MLGVGREVTEDAVMAAGLDPVTGVHRSKVEQVRQIVVEWLRDASPNVHPATESAGQWVDTPPAEAWPIAKATPYARGRCDAIVEVCGITASL